MLRRNVNAAAPPKMPLHIYFAGPDVFHPDYAAHRRHVASLCEERGFVPLFPGDEVSGDDPESIFRDNLRLIDRADAVVANLNAFRGAEPDSGTCFELGYAHALGKRLFGHVATGESVVERVARLVGASRGCDAGGYRIEDFGLPLNLMLAVPAQVIHGEVADCLDCVGRAYGG